MKQVLQERRSGHTVVRNVPMPSCRPGGVLVRTAFSAISSGTERARVELSRKSLLGKARERPDLVRAVVDRARREGVRATMQAVQRRLGGETAVGYSCAGTVVEVGEHVRGLRPGDLVACAGGNASHAEFVTVPGNLCVRVPEGVPPDCAAMTTIAAVALHGIRLADARVGSRAAVIGCGLVGQLALRLLRAAGAETFALDIDPRRVEQARVAGADHVFAIDRDTRAEVWASSGDVGVDAVVVAAASSGSAPLSLATEIARDRGSVVLVGSVPIALPRAGLYDKELHFRVSRSYGPGRYDAEYEERGLDYPIGYVRWTERRNMEAVLRLQAQGLMSFADLFEVVPVEQAPEAYARLTGASGDRPRGALVLAYGNGAAVLPGARSDGSFGNAVLPRRLEGRRRLAPRPSGNGVAQGSLPKVGARHVPVRIGLIGPGSFAGRVLVPALQAAGADLRVVGGGSGPSAVAAARSGAFARVAGDASSVIEDPDVDAVVIVTRHGDHARLVVEALRAGKHVFCEKPLALSSEELDAVMNAAREAPGTLLVGFNRRFSPLLEAMRSFLTRPGRPMTLTYRVSAGAIADDHWVHDLAQGGGRALGEAGHFIDSLAFLVGRPVTEVRASGYGPESRALQALDNFVATLRFLDGSVASLVYVADGSAGVPKERIEGFCGDRTALLDDYLALELYDGASRATRRLKNQDKGHRQEMVEFLRAARTGQPAVGLPEIDNVTLATLLIVESLRVGRPVAMDS